MKVAVFLKHGPHGHNYGADFLFDGLVHVLGFHNVLDWPEADHLHLTLEEPRDACNIDSDQCWPRKGHGWEDVCTADVAIVTDGDPHDLKDLPVSIPVVATDFHDSQEYRRSHYTGILGGRLPDLYCKREYRLDATYPAASLPLSYPARRFKPAFRWKVPRVFYHATSHGFLPTEPLPQYAAPVWSGLPRYLIATGLLERLRPDQRDISVHAGQAKGTRLPLGVYHARMLDSLVGISWNTGPAWPTYDCNRLWENFACGLAQVIERPTIHLPFPPEDGVHCLYADNPADVVDKVVALLADPDRALAMAVAGHEWFLRHHSSEARARYLLDLIERELGVKNERPVAGAPVGG